MKLSSGRRRAAWGAAVSTAALSAVVVTSGFAGAQADTAVKQPATGAASGQLSPVKFTVASAVKIDLARQLVRLPLHKGVYAGRTVWYILTDASDQGAAESLGLNFAPKLANAGIGCKACVQDVTLTGSAGNVFGEGLIHFAGVPNFAPARVLKAGPTQFPPAVATPGAVGGAHYSPFIRIRGAQTVYNAPIVAVGDGPFDVEHHTNTSDRVLAVHPAAPSAAGEFHGASVDLLFIRGFDSGKPIIYLSTESDDAATAVLERATYVPALKRAPFVGGDDFLGSVRERIFPFVNGRTGGGSQAQGLAHLIADGHASEDASLKNTALLSALAHGGDALNVQGDFPTLEQGNRRAAYSPLWEAQFGEWTEKAKRSGRDVRQTDEFAILAFAKAHPDLLTAPGGAPYGSVKAQINCPVIAFLAVEPKRDLIDPAPGSQVDVPGSYYQGE